MELSRKDENAVAKVTERAKPTLVTIGNRQVISSGRWNDELAAHYVMTHGRDKWLSVGDLAKLAYGQNVPRSKKMVRRRIASLFHTIRNEYGEFLVVEYGPPNNRAKAVKLFDVKSEMERQAVRSRLESMRKRREMTAEQYQSAILVLQEKEAAIRAA
jgi:hypothetical protein